MELALILVIAVLIVGFVAVTGIRRKTTKKILPSEENRSSLASTQIRSESEQTTGEDRADSPQAVISPAELGQALKRSRGIFGQMLSRIKPGGDLKEILESVEATLLLADVGPAVTDRVIQELGTRLKGKRLDRSVVMSELKLELRSQFLDTDRGLLVTGERPFVVLMVGVNGSGKTTTLGKLAVRFARDGYKVVIAAADTFRAAATEQAAIWADRAGVEIVSGQPGADPASVVYDAIDHARARGADLVLCDTAGRLQNKSNLMEELRKVKRVAEKGVGRPADEILLVLDATTGQNGISQAQVFKEAVDITGVCLTKLDGSAKGGVALAIEATLEIPIKLVGIGEGPDDLKPFDTDEFVEELVGGEL
jgi:fused signal recognition particle receptor